MGLLGEVMSLGTELAPIPLGPQGDCWGRGTNIASDVFFSGLDETSRLSRAELGQARPPRLLTNGERTT